MATNETKTDTSVFAELQNQKYILLKTFRKSGEAVATQVWFAQAGERLYVTTIKTAGKLKRLRNNSQVLLAPCDSRGKVLGQELAGEARELTPHEQVYANKVLAEKFGFLYQVFMFMGRLRKTERTYIEIIPEIRATGL